MFDHSGDTVCFLAIVEFVLAIIGTIVGAFLCFNISFWAGIAVLIGGIFSAWISSVVLYAVGTSASESEKISVKSDSIEAQLKRQEKTITELYALVDSMKATIVRMSENSEIRSAEASVISKVETNGRPDKVTEKPVDFVLPANDDAFLEELGKMANAVEMSKALKERLADSTDTDARHLIDVVQSNGVFEKQYDANAGEPTFKIIKAFFDNAMCASEPVKVKDGVTCKLCGKTQSARREFCSQCYVLFKV